MSKLLLLFMLIIACADLATAQRSNSFKNIEDFHVGYSLGVQVGSQGFGLNAAYAPTEVLAFRMAFSFAPVGLNSTRNFGDHDYDVDMKAQFCNAAALVEVNPFRRSSNRSFMKQLAIVSGLGYFFDAEAKAIAAPQNDYHYGEILIPKEDLGSVSTRVKWKGFAPYLGAGIRNIFLNGFLELNVDLGTYYLSAPGVSMTADKMLSENAVYAPRVQENMKGYRWLPVIQVGISHRF